MTLSLFLVLFVSQAWGQIPDFNAAVQNVGKAATLDCKTCEEKKTCEIISPRSHLKLYPENWGLLSTGVDLMQADPAFKDINYTLKLGVVDSGLKVNGNPSAGDKLGKDSPETDLNGHGSHVIGISSSKEFGVNPNLPAKMFPVGNAGGNAHDSDLLNALSKAIDDPSIRVINMSWSFYESPKTVDLVDEATKKGKWIIFAAGNENSVSNIQITGHDHFVNNPSFFKVGSSSAFGSPSSFSNFGPDVTIYAPGSDITSLSNHYNANLLETKGTTSMGGTSMASPHFSSVLSTLANMAPKVNATEMKELLSMTSINRGTEKRPFLFLNAYLAYETLKMSLPCLEKGNVPKTCFSESVKRLGQTPIPKKPSSESCSDVKQYYNDLRKHYFLTKGSMAATKALELVLKDEPRPIAEKFIFSNDQSNLQSILSSSKLPGTYKVEADRAVAFFSGKLDIDVVSQRVEPSKKAETQNDKSPLDLLLPVKENLPEYLKYCQESLDKKTESSSACHGFLAEAPRRFKEEMIKYLEMRKPAAFKSEVLQSLDFNYDDQYNEKLKPIYLKASEQCLADKSCELDDAKEVARSIYLTAAEKGEFSKNFISLFDKKFFTAKYDEKLFWDKESLDYLRLCMIVLGSDESDESIKLKIQPIFGKSTGSASFRDLTGWSNKSPHISDTMAELRLNFLRLVLGGESPGLYNALVEVIKKENFSGGVENIKEMLNVLLSGPYIKNVVKMFEDPTIFELLEKNMLSDSIKLLFKNEYLTNVEKEKIANAFITFHENNKPQYVRNYFKTFHENQSIPAINNFLREVRSSAGKKNSVLYAWLLDQDLSSGQIMLYSNKEVQKYLSKSKFQSLSFKISQNLENEAFKNQYRKDLEAVSKLKKRLDNNVIFREISDLDQKSCEVYCDILLKALPNIITHGYVPASEVPELLKKIIFFKGGDRKLMAEMIDVLNKLPKNSFSDIFVTSLIALNNTKVGNELLKNHAIWDRAKELVSMPHFQLNFDSRWSPDDSQNIMIVPEQLKPIYLERMKQVLLYSDDTDIAQYNIFSTDFDFIKLVVDAMVENQKVEDKNYHKLGFQTHVLDYVRRSPEHSRQLRDYIKDKNLNFYHKIFFFGPAQVLPLETIVEKFEDYEN